MEIEDTEEYTQTERRKEETEQFALSDKCHNRPTETRERRDT